MVRECGMMVFKQFYMVDWLTFRVAQQKRNLKKKKILFRILFHGVFQYLEYTGALFEKMHKIHIIYLFIF